VYLRCVEDAIPPVSSSPSFVVRTLMVSSGMKIESHVFVSAMAAARASLCAISTPMVYLVITFKSISQPFNTLGSGRSARFRGRP
jgi:hypothetical protein